ncbi:hypothetical protein EGR_07728 [Echinococcus granulosus]|uniref:Uncharacterized protein n=1 Tax=Echinococcus granulosus TaxID=6210 RepID=W6UVD3_ECHGR|nr:hypothetical protein EGR_07728 [Echinococcus granulosus]EUB57404.1 hypothetical protein EGR_07728 [Echinococcus granulosus]
MSSRIHLRYLASLDPYLNQQIKMTERDSLNPFLIVRSSSSFYKYFMPKNALFITLCFIHLKQNVNLQVFLDLLSTTRLFGSEHRGIERFLGVTKMHITRKFSIMLSIVLPKDRRKGVFSQTNFAITVNTVYSKKKRLFLYTLWQFFLPVASKFVLFIPFQNVYCRTDPRAESSSSLQAWNFLETLAEDTQEVKVFILRKLTHLQMPFLVKYGCHKYVTRCISGYDSW